MLFVPIELSRFNATFGLRGRALKQFFPHLFNRNDRFGYCGPVPDAAFFSPDTMTPATRRDFLAWHAERSVSGNYDFDAEILRYCENDVTILALGVMAFRHLVIEVTGFCPFSKWMTLSSTAMRIYKKSFLAEYYEAEVADDNPVTLTKRNGEYYGLDGEKVRGNVKNPRFVSSDLAYQQKTSMAGPNHSKVSLQWLTYQSSLHPDSNIRSAMSPKGEYRAGPYYFDGVDEGRKIVYEFHGCLYHACATCYASLDDQKHPLTELTMAETWARTLAKERWIDEHYVRAQNYPYVSTRECDWNRQVTTDTAIKTFVEGLDPDAFVSRLDVRDAFYSGRVETFSLYQEAAADEAICYYYFTSLYPYVQKSSMYG